MARSTIQEKLSGKSPAKLSQILAIVESIAEYGRINGTPLSPQEVEENSWRAKYVAAMGNRGSTGSASLRNEPSTYDRVWNPQPLLAAGMSDLVDLVSQSQGAPMSTWVPHVATEMATAEMSCKNLMEWVAQGEIKDILHCIKALDQAFPLPNQGPPEPWENWSTGYGATTEILFRYVARTHGRNSAPVVTVGLRRASLGYFVNTFLASVARWHLATNLAVAVQRLRAAELGKDANTLLLFVGSTRMDTRVLEVVHHFLDNNSDKDAERVLEGMSSGSPERLVIALRDDKCDPMREALINSIPWNKHSEYGNHLRAEGFSEIANTFDPPSTGGYMDEPPF
ncbi:hypothetical protein AB0L83_14850 [Streptomyces sp. NPDC052071]|uniref:hypothetical protein n=1 Tax=Streptomyces sp. NPDC052071 TaxID=3156666 RepID=UPI00342D8E7A